MTRHYKQLLVRSIALLAGPMLALASPPPAAATADAPAAGRLAVIEFSNPSSSDATPVGLQVAVGRTLNRDADPGAGNPGQAPTQTRLTASDGAPNDVFGISVALEGDTAVVGSVLADVAGNSNQGAAYVFVRTGDTWVEKAKLTASDGAANDQFGISVTVEGDTALVGGWFAGVGGNSQQGAAWVFTRAGQVWTEQAKLVAADGRANDRFGYSVGRR